MRLEEWTAEEDGKVTIYRIWKCCGKEWYRNYPLPTTFDSLSWTPVCPSCGGFDGTLFI